MHGPLTCAHARLRGPWLCSREAGMPAARSYGMHDFHEDLKKMYLTAGVDGKPLVFLLADTEIVHEVLRAQLSAHACVCAHAWVLRVCVRACDVLGCGDRASLRTSTTC